MLEPVGPLASKLNLQLVDELVLDVCDALSVVVLCALYELPRLVVGGEGLDGLV